MKRSLVEIYGLAVCFFTVACFVIVLGIALWGAIELTVPEFTIDNSTYEKHQSDEAFRDSLLRQIGVMKKMKILMCRQREWHLRMQENVAMLKSFDLKDGKRFRIW